MMAVKTWANRTKAGKAEAAVISRLEAAVRKELYTGTGPIDPLVLDRKLDEVKAWSNAIASLYSKVTSVIGSRTIPFKWSEDVPIAGTDGRDVYLGTEWFCEHIVPAIMRREMSSTGKTLMAVKGVAYHELAHVLWTPRANHKPVSGFKNNTDLFRTFNVLEDQRIESLFVATYKPAARFFTEAVLKYIVEGSGKLADKAHILTHGRRFLPTEVRQGLRALFITSNDVDEDFINELESIIDEYRMIAFPKDADRAVELITRFHEMLRNMNLSDRLDDLVVSDGHDDHKSGSTETAANQSASRQKLEDSDKEDSDSDESDSGDSDEASDEADSGSASGSSDDGDGHDASAADDDSGADDSTLGNPTNGASKSVGGGASTDLGDLEAEVMEAIEDTLDDVTADIDDEGTKTLKSLNDTVKGVAEGLAPKVPDRIRASGATVNVTPGMKAGSRQLQDWITKAVTDCEEDWERGQSEGRLHVGDAMNAMGRHFDVFSKWEDNSDGLSFEVVILLDMSSSMGHANGYHVDDAYRAAQANWIIRKAFTALDIPVHVIGYHSYTHYLSGPGCAVANDTFDLPVRGEATDPDEAIRWATSILSNSTAANRLLVSITDGDWHLTNETEKRMHQMRAAGIKSTLVRIESVYSMQEPRGGRSKEYWELWHDRVLPLTSETVNQLPKKLGETLTGLVGRALV
jgi:hypothetical protein